MSVERGPEFSLVSHVLHFEKTHREWKEKANKILPYFFWHHKSDMIQRLEWTWYASKNVFLNIDG